MPATKDRSWLAGFACTCAAVLLVWLLLPLATRGAVVEGNRWVREGLARKIAASRARDGKVVLLGGSNVLFGLSARRLEEAHGIPSVNLAQHAGLGRPYILHYALDAVRPGDVVVLVLEYALWETEKSRDTRNYYVLAHDTAYLYHLPPLQLLAFLAGVQPREWLTLLRARHTPGTRPPGGYDAATLDGWGDETINRPEAVTPAMHAAVTSEPPRGPFVLDPAAVDDVRTFATRLQTRGARLVLGYPALFRRDFAWNVNRPFYAALVTAIDRAGLAAVGRPEDSPFDEPCLFDARYHTTLPCTAANTDRLARQLVDRGLVGRARGAP